MSSKWNIAIVVSAKTSVKFPENVGALELFGEIP